MRYVSEIFILKKAEYKSEAAKFTVIRLVKEWQRELLNCRTKKDPNNLKYFQST
jgi:hypothetical protein